MSNEGILNTFCTALKLLYNNVLCFVRINGNITYWIGVNSGLKQRCPLYPVLINLYINNLVSFLKSYDCGIDNNEEKVCILLYADDVVIIGNDKNELQTLQNAYSLWCTINAVKINTVVHFIPPSVVRSDFIC